MKRRNRFLRAGVFVSFLLLFAACQQQGLVSVTGVSLNKDAIDLFVGDAETLSATVRPKRATIKFVSWDSDDEEIAVVNGRGRVTAVAEGETVITVTTWDSGGNADGFTAECVVTVRLPVPVTGVTLEPTTMFLTLGENGILSLPITAEVEPEDATNKGVKWSCDDTEIAEIEVDEDNMFAATVTAVAPGKTTVIVTTDDGGFTARCTVTVLKKPDIDMITIPGGTFSMGSPAAEPGHLPDESPQRTVTIASFRMSKYQIRQEDYGTVMDTTIEKQQVSVPTTTVGNSGRGDKFPMYYVSWYETLVFCNRLSMIEGRVPVYSISGSTDPADWGRPPQLPTVLPRWDAVTVNQNANGYRMPTEAEWEYACRASTTTAYNTGRDDITRSTGWYTGNSGGTKSQEVGQLPTNAFGLYDMHGNVSEWCWDLYEYYPGNTLVMEVERYNTRVVRGGAWFDNARDLRSASRNSFLPSAQSNGIGIRVVLPLGEE